MSTEAVLANFNHPLISKKKHKQDIEEYVFSPNTQMTKKEDL